jgi:hypothetical protein
MIDGAAEHAVAADRFAREIAGFLKVIGGALAAAERQSVGPKAKLCCRGAVSKSIKVVPLSRYGHCNNSLFSHQVYAAWGRTTYEQYGVSEHADAKYAALQQVQLSAVWSSVDRVSVQ